MSYSEDLRKKVIEFIENGNGVTKAAITFGITRTTIYKWQRLKKKNGNLLDAPPKRSWKKVDPNRLKTFVKNHCDFTLKEYAKQFGTSTVAICRALKRLKITRKKRLIFTGNGMKSSGLYFWSK